MLDKISNHIKNPKKYCFPFLVFLLLFLASAFLVSSLGEKGKQAAQPKKIKISEPSGENKDSPSISNSKNPNIKITNKAKSKLLKEIKGDSNSISFLPSEIIERIDSSPLLQQEDVKKYYIGLNVEWVLNVYSINKIDHNSVQVQSKLGDSPSPTVLFTVNFDENKILGLLENGDRIKVSGKISEIIVFFIFLEDVKFAIE